MKRKTNLFYLNGQDSNFITFSNYTESLTGNFLSTNTKIFPSVFLCLNFSQLIPESNDGTTFSQRKSEFIKYLAAYYENKLAFLRDYLITNNTIADGNLNPLSYLIDILYHTKWDNDKFSYDLETKNSDIICYIGDIAELDYNGIFADNICVIDNKILISDIEINYDNSISVKTANVKTYLTDEIAYKRFGSSSDDIVTFTNSALSKLYGWYDEEVEDYKNVQPIYDTDTYEYYLTNNLQNIKYKVNTDYTGDFKFNVVIPLFNVLNVDTDEEQYDWKNSKIFSTEVDDLITYEIIDLTSSQLNSDLVPLGLWFSGESQISLPFDNTTNFRPSWSLCISSQFKPFPYSKPENMPNEVYNSDLEEKYHAFQKANVRTFAQILANQTDLLESLNENTSALADIRTKMKTIEDDVNNISDVSNYRSLRYEFEEHVILYDTLFKEFSQHLTDYENLLKSLLAHITTSDYMHNYILAYVNTQDTYVLNESNAYTDTQIYSYITTESFIRETNDKALDDYIKTSMTYVEQTFVKSSTFYDFTIYADDTYVRSDYADVTFVKSSYLDDTYVKSHYANRTFVKSSYANTTFVKSSYADTTFVKSSYLASMYLQSASDSIYCKSGDVYIKSSDINIYTYYTSIYKKNF